MVDFRTFAEGGPTHGSSGRCSEAAGLVAAVGGLAAFVLAVGAEKVSGTVIDGIGRVW